MSEEYLKRVFIYLQQEMPEHKDHMALGPGGFVFSLPLDAAFQSYYENIHASVTSCIGRIRNRETDLNFKVWSPNQERDFKVLK